MSWDRAYPFKVRLKLGTIVVRDRPSLGLCLTDIDLKAPLLPPGRYRKEREPIFRLEAR